MHATTSQLCSTAPNGPARCTLCSIALQCLKSSWQRNGRILAVVRPCFCLFVLPVSKSSRICCSALFISSYDLFLSSLSCARASPRRKASRTFRRASRRVCCRCRSCSSKELADSCASKPSWDLWITISFARELYHWRHSSRPLCSVPMSSTRPGRSVACLRPDRSVASPMSAMLGMPCCQMRTATFLSPRNLRRRLSVKDR